MHSTKLGSVVGLLEALEGTATAAWAWDLDNGGIHWSENAGPLFGLERGHQPRSVESVIDIVHPDDRSALRAAIAGATDRSEDYELDFRVTKPDGTVRWLSVRGHVVLDETGTARRLVGLISDVTARQRRSEEAQFLASAGEMLAGTLDVDEMVERVAALLVDRLADWCVVQLLDDGHQPVVAHRDPKMVALATRLQAEYPPEPEPTELARQVIETGRAVLVADVTDDMLEAGARDADHLAIMRSLGLRSALTAPLFARGRVIGLITLISAESAYRFDEADVAFAEDFGRRAGLALDNAHLLEAADRARQVAEATTERLGLLQDVIADLAKASSVDAVAAVAIDKALVALAADRGAVVLLGESGPTIVASAGYPPERLDAMAPSLRQPGPLGDSWSRGAAVYCETIAELISRYPNLAEVMQPIRHGAFAAIPLFGAQGPLGSIGIVYDSDRTFSVEERRLMDALAQHIGVALERSHLFDRINTVAETLQAALAPPPDVGCAAVTGAAHYRTAGPGQVGGDWYDAVITTRGTHMYVIGDVVGRGLEAVAAMAQLRQSARLLISQGSAPHEVLAGLSGFASGERGALAATVQCAEVDAERGEVTLSSAGHLPPIVLGHGLAEPVAVPLGPPLGVTGRPYRSVTVRLDPGHCLVMYTDGVVERRDRSIDDSLGDLLARLATLPPDVEVVADDMLKLAEEADDDATILVLALAGAG